MNKDIIYVRIDEGLKKDLDMIALEEQRSLNNLVVYVLSKFVENNKNKNINNSEKKYLKQSWFLENDFIFSK